jgi:hypothetical protein
VLAAGRSNLNEPSAPVRALIPNSRAQTNTPLWFPFGYSSTPSRLMNPLIVLCGISLFEENGFSSHEKEIISTKGSIK